MLHVSTFEKYIFKVHVVALLGQFVHLVELVHIQLPDEWTHFLVSEKQREHFLLELLGMFDNYLRISRPAKVALILLALNETDFT